MITVRRNRLEVALLGVALVASWLLSACGSEPVGAGAACLRSSQCPSGFACVEGVCSDDLSPLEDPARVPMLTPVVPDAAVVTPDAAVVVPDAAVVTPDAAFMDAATGPDAG